MHDNAVIVIFFLCLTGVLLTLSMMAERDAASNDEETARHGRRLYSMLCVVWLGVFVAPPILFVLYSAISYLFHP